MGTLIVSTHVTLDGVIGPEPDWARIDDDVQAHSFDQLRAADALLLGRTTFEGLAGVWPDSPDPSGFADRINAIPKHVVSRTLTGPLPWNGTVVEGDRAESVGRLKGELRCNLLSYGCGELATSLVALGLVDEIHLWVHPVVVGEGERLFGGRPVRMELLSSTTFPSGVVLSAYRPLSRTEVG